MSTSIPDPNPQPTPPGPVQVTAIMSMTPPPSAGPTPVPMPWPPSAPLQQPRAAAQMNIDGTVTVPLDVTREELLQVIGIMGKLIHECRMAWPEGLPRPDGLPERPAIP